MRTGPSGSVKGAYLVQPSRHESDVSGEGSLPGDPLIDRHALLPEIDRRHRAATARAITCAPVGFPSGSRGSATAEPTPVVFVVDDDVSVRESLELLIRAAGWQPETFRSAREFLSHPRVLAPGCLVLDVHLPGLSGLDLQERVAVERVDLPIILITGYGDVPMAVRAMKAGAVEVLTKPFQDDVLLGAIRKAIDRSRAALRDEGETRALRESYASLSPREREVMGCVVSGLLNKQVGAELGISEITVKAHRGKVMRKMKAASLADLVRMAARLGVAPVRP